MKWFASIMREQIKRVSVDSCSKTKKATINEGLDTADLLIARGILDELVEKP
jgi:hypothetical protein